MEQILIRNLPDGTKAALRSRAERHDRSVEAEAREILAEGIRREPATLVDLLSSPDVEVAVDFDPPRLGLAPRTPDL